MAIERAPAGTSLTDVLDRVLDEGIVIDAYVRASLMGTLPSVSRPQFLSSGDSAELGRMRAENLELRRRSEEAE